MNWPDIMLDTYVLTTVIFFAKKNINHLFHLEKKNYSVVINNGNCWLIFNKLLLLLF